MSPAVNFKNETCKLQQQFLTGRHGKGNHIRVFQRETEVKSHTEIFLLVQKSQLLQEMQYANAVKKHDMFKTLQY